MYVVYNYSIFFPDYLASFKLSLIYLYTSYAYALQVSKIKDKNNYT